MNIVNNGANIVIFFIKEKTLPNQKKNTTFIPPNIIYTEQIYFYEKNPNPN